jgi:hypothetical protein
MSKSAATHSGHCQACNSLQKLPNGKLSLHGYTVGHGFFSGICPGSKELPYEKSHALIKTFMQNAERHLGDVQTLQAMYRKPAESTTCWVHPYIAANWRGFRGGHVWMKAEIRADDSAWTGVNEKYLECDHATEIVFTNSHPMADDMRRRCVLERYVKKSKLDLLAIATKQNSAYADFLESEVKSLQRYIAWQRMRISAWVPDAPLLPVTAKDKSAAFKPEEAR